MPRNCTVCLHPQRQKIEGDLRARLSCRATAQKYAISKDSAARHRRHVSLHNAPLATVTKVIAILDDAETSANFSICLRMVQEARRCAKELLTQL
jgi:hypothetical protein